MQCGAVHRYARAVHGSDLSTAMKLLAAADVYQAVLEARPHRPAYSQRAAAKLLASAAYYVSNWKRFAAALTPIG